MRILDSDGNPGSLDTFAEVVRVNLVGTYNVLRLGAARIARSEPAAGERGAIVLTASVAAFDGQIGQTSYTASQGRRPRHHPGRRPRPGEQADPGEHDRPRRLRHPDAGAAASGHPRGLERSVPHPSRLGAPDDYAHMAVSLLENPYVNGETIRLDGAIRMPPR